MRQPFAGAQVEGHAGPAPVGDADLHRHEGLGHRSRACRCRAGSSEPDAPSAKPARYCPRTVSGGGVRVVDRLERLQHLQLLVAQRVGLHRVRRLHGDEAQELHHMVLHHVADRAGVVVVGAAALDAERLGDRDLHVVDMRVVPHRLEEGVGEAQRHQVLHRLLAEIVVDAEDRALGEDGADVVVDRVGARAVVADRLLDDDARARRREALRAEPLGDRAEEVGAGRKIEGADAFVRPERRLELGPAGVVRRVRRDVVETRAGTARGRRPCRLRPR